MATGAETGTDEQPPAGTRVERFARRRWYERPVVVILAVTALAGGLRFYRLSSPHTYVFDEVYYAKDGCFDAGLPFQACGLKTPAEQTRTVHPPLGVWIIAAGIRWFGAECPDADAGCPARATFGWRVAAATFGTLSVLLLALLALRLFGSAVWAGVAGLLLAAENLNFVQSRVAMLDIFLTTFVVAGFLFLALDRQWIDRRTPPPPEETDQELLLGIPPEGPPSPILRPWRIAAGLAFGAAAATKWSGGVALVAAIVLSIAWERTRRKQYRLPRPIGSALRDEAFAIFAFLVLLPIAVYVASYAAFWADHGFGAAAWSAWMRLQLGMADFSLNLRATHPYASRPWWWVLLKRPVAYYYECRAYRGTACARPAEIMALGNPLVFWGSVITIPYAVASWIRRHDWRAGLIVGAFVLQYLPWFLAFRTSFLFYMTPITPFMVLAMVYILKDLADVRFGLRERRGLAPVAAFVVIAIVATFVFFVPVQTGRTLSYQGWSSRMWFEQCSPKPTWCWI